MSQDPLPSWRERWIEELLRASGGGDSDDDAAEELRIRRLMQAVANEPRESVEWDEPRVRDSQANSGDWDQASPRSFRPGRRWGRWVSVVLAASIVVPLVMIVQQGSSMQQALAAVEKSIQAAAELEPRHYRVTLVFDRPRMGSEQVVECDLYVRGNQQFAFRHPALIGSGDLWIGRNGDESWVVPARGPIRMGEETAVSRWLEGTQELLTPYLHVTSILERLARGYRMVENTDGVPALPGLATDRLANAAWQERLDGCHHIVGVRKNSQNQTIPAQIDLWCDRSSGVAVLLQAQWDPPALPWGRVAMRVELVGAIELADDWFDHRGHHDGRRLLLKLDGRDSE